MCLPSDIVLLPFPYTDLSATKRRPVLVLSAPDARGDFLAVQVTSQPGHVGAEQIQDADLEIGALPKASFIRPERLFTLNRSLVVQRAGRLQDTSFTRIRSAVCERLGCKTQPTP